MPISDNNPERRNLVVTSSIFIIYFLGGGTIGNTIRLQPISIDFTNVTTLAFIAWVLLFWFALRYHQKNRGELSRSVYEELQTENRSFLLIKYLTRKTNKPYRQKDGFTIKQTRIKSGTWETIVSFIRGGEQGPGGAWVGYKEGGSQSFEITHAWLGIIRASVIINLFIKRPGIGSFFVPYVLFAFAVLLGIWRALPDLYDLTPF